VAIEGAFVADPKRIVLGAVVAPTAASLIGSISMGDFWSLWLVALLSTMPVYLAVILWRLPRTTRPLLTCLLIGALTAPGIVGYIFGLVGTMVAADASAMLVILFFSAPFGLLGGAVFWLCAVWRSEAPQAKEGG
jgi:hypothetical protein